MLGKRSSYLPVRIFMELQHSLRLASISQSLISKSAGKNVLLILRACARLAREKLKVIECERTYSRHKSCSRRITRKFLACIQRIKSLNILEAAPEAGTNLHFPSIEASS